VGRAAAARLAQIELPSPKDEGRRHSKRLEQLHCDSRLFTSDSCSLSARLFSVSLPLAVDSRTSSSCFPRSLAPPCPLQMPQMFPKVHLLRAAPAAPHELQTAASLWAKIGQKKLVSLQKLSCKRRGRKPSGRGNVVEVGFHLRRVELGRSSCCCC